MKQEKGLSKGALLEQEAEEKISKMEEKGYAFPHPLKRRDYIIIGLLVVIGIILLLLGGYL